MNPTTDEDMKSEYDFSGGKRAQFFQPNLKLNLAVYLDAEVVSYLNAIAKKQGKPLSEVAAGWPGSWAMRSMNDSWRCRRVVLALVGAVAQASGSPTSAVAHRAISVLRRRLDRNCPLLFTHPERRYNAGDASDQGMPAGSFLYRRQSSGYNNGRSRTTIAASSMARTCGYSSA